MKGVLHFGKFPSCQGLDKKIDIHYINFWEPNCQTNTKTQTYWVCHMWKKHLRIQFSAFQLINYLLKDKKNVLCAMCSVGLRSSGTSSAVARCPINSTRSAASILLLSIIGVWREGLPPKYSDAPPPLSVTLSEDTCTLTTTGRERKREKESQR